MAGSTSSAPRNSAISKNPSLGGIAGASESAGEPGAGRKFGAVRLNGSISSGLTTLMVEALAATSVDAPDAIVISWG